MTGAHDSALRVLLVDDEPDQASCTDTPSKTLAMSW